MAKYKLVPVASNEDTIPEMELENFEFDKTKEHVVAITIDVDDIAPQDIFYYIERIKTQINDVFPKNVQTIYIPRRKNDLTGVWKVL